MRVILVLAGAAVLFIVAVMITISDPQSYLVQEQQWDNVIISFEGEGYSHGQGVAADEQYIYYSGNSILKKAYIENPNWAHPLAVNLTARFDGTQVDQINGICLEKDYLYASGTKFNELPYRNWVKWYDKDTLKFVGEKELFWNSRGSSQEGIDYSEDYWWAVYFDSAEVTQYDSNFNYLRSIELPGQPLEIQGLDWYKGQLWVGTTEGPIRVYNWNGKSFSLSTTLKLPSQIRYAQGFSIASDGKYLYYVDFTGSLPSIKEINRLHKVRVK